jgi:hypothetical protein
LLSGNQSIDQSSIPLIIMSSKRDVDDTETNHDETAEEPPPSSSFPAKKQRVDEGNENEAVVETLEEKEDGEALSSSNNDAEEETSKSLSDTAATLADSPTPPAEVDQEDKEALSGSNNNKGKATEKKPLPKPLFPPMGPPDDGKDLVLDPLPEPDGNDDDPTTATATTSTTAPSATTELLTTASIVLFGLHPGITTPRLSKFLEHYGPTEVVDVKMAFASRYGICTFTDVSSAQKAMEAIHGRSILGRTIMVRPGQSSQRSQPRTEDQVLPLS